MPGISLRCLAGVQGVRGNVMRMFIHEISNPVSTIPISPWDKLTTITRNINRAQRYNVVIANTVCGSHWLWIPITERPL